MTKNKRIILLAVFVLAIAAAAVLLLRPFSGGGTYDNLISNGDFSERTDQGLPVRWSTRAYWSRASFDVEMEDGRPIAHIVNHEPEDAWFGQTVSVSPGTLYCLRGWIRAEASGGMGANLSIEGVSVYSDPLYDTAGEWQEVRLYGRTGRSQTSVNVLARIGGYSSEATGEAWFRDITLQRVDRVAPDYPEYQWELPSAPVPSPSGAASTGAPVILAALAAYGLLACFLCRFLRLHREDDLAAGNASSWLPPLLVLSGAFTMRLIIALAVPGYDVDIGCFRSWSAMMAVSGPSRFYSAASFCDYPPGYLWILWVLGLLGKALGTGVTEFMVKLPPILADLVLCALLWTEAKKLLSPRAALACVALYAFNPLILVTGAAWGQADALMVLLLCLVVIHAIRGRWRWALPLYMAAVLVKPQALMFGPLGLAALVLSIAQNAKDTQLRREIVRGMLYLAAVAAVIVVPFSVHQSADWLLTLYARTMGQYSYATVNACNPYLLLGKNWAPADSFLNGQWFLPVLIWLLSVLPVLVAGLVPFPKAPGKLAHKPDRLPMLVLSVLSGALAVAMIVLALMGSMTYASLGATMVVYCVAAVCSLYVFSHDARNLPVYGAILLLALFNTGSMMHERYLVPAVALLLLGYLLKKDKWLLYLALGVTACGFLNVACALDRNIRIGGAAGHLDAPIVAIRSDLRFLEYLSAAGNGLLCLLSLGYGAALSREDLSRFQAQAAPPVPAVSSPRREAPLPTYDVSDRRMTRRDWLILLSVTVSYAVLAFVNLGSMTAPQNAFVSVDPNEQVTMDLGEERTFHALYFPGIHYNEDDESYNEVPRYFTLEISSDGEMWDQLCAGSVYNSDCFKWKYVTSQPFTGRYVRLSANSYDLTLFELLLRDTETGKGITAQSVTDSLGRDASALNDEPDTLEGEPGWYNSTYFDEIYHARSGYELLHGLNVYEWTHPPLGKVCMSWCIALFGMTPFGWRFAGAMAGVMMLPGMYLLGKLLLRRRWGGTAAVALMALDLMHFTQTRIATIDSFVVLFIIWMVYFMLRWFFQDFFSRPFWKTLIPLALSGLGFGLAIASKWTGVYAGLGLAVIFFYGIIRRYRLVLAARQVAPEKRTTAQEAAARGGKYLLLTIASCLVLFVAIPLGIYYLSYVPFFASRGGITVDGVIREAVGTYFTNGYMGGMLGYHGQPGFGMNHPFYSPWYQWPVIGKPMWYASSAYEPKGYQSTIMALGNPAVWWPGLLGVMGVCFLWARRHVRADHSLALYPETDDPRWTLLLICFLAQFLPWMLVPRGTYIYHYFPSVPFIILCALLCLDHLSERHERLARHAVAVLIAAAAVLFIAFFPYASGITVPTAWLDAMKWFPNWLYY